MTDIMVDLETMGTSNDAAIISIGAVRFSFDTGLLGEEYYEVITLKSSVESGGKIDSDTVLWWLGQSEEARADFLDKKGIRIHSALLAFAAFCQMEKFNGLWGNGATFDNVILRNAYTREGITPPWAYWQDRCYRTIKGVYPTVDTSGWETVKHNALADAKWQARYLLEAMKV